MDKVNVVGILTARVGRVDFANSGKADCEIHDQYTVHGLSALFQTQALVLGEAKSRQRQYLHCGTLIISGREGVKNHEMKWW